MRLATTLLAISSVAGLAAADLDLRLGYLLRSTSTDITAGSSTVSDNWDRSDRIFAELLIQPAPSLVGGVWLFGAKVVVDQADVSDNTNGDVTYSNVALQAEAGYGFVATPLVRIEVLPYFGIGYTTLDVEAFDEGSASSIEFGLNVGVSVTLPAGFQLGALVGYAWSTAKPSIDGTSVEVENSGVIGGLFLGWRL